MGQLGQLHQMYDEFEKRDTVVIAIAQEDKDLKSHAKILASFKSKPRFPIALDVGREQTEKYKRTTAYLIDRDGVVQQIFPMLIHARPSWSAILSEIDQLQKK